MVNHVVLDKARYKGSNQGTQDNSLNTTRPTVSDQAPDSASCCTLGVQSNPSWCRLNLFGKPDPSFAIVVDHILVLDKQVTQQNTLFIIYVEEYCMDK